MQEHIIVRLLTRIFDFLLLNVLWVLCSIPVISLGASTTALYSVMLKIVENEEGYIIWDFLKAFKRNFRQSTTVWCILLGIGVAHFCGLSVCAEHFGSDANDRNGIAWNDCISIYI